MQPNFHHRSCARCARTEGTGHPRCQKRSMNTGLGRTGARRIFGRRQINGRRNPSAIREIERVSCAQKIPRNFFYVLRADRSDVSRLKHPVHRADAATGRGSLEHHRYRPRQRRHGRGTARSRSSGSCGRRRSNSAAVCGRHSCERSSGSVRRRTTDGGGSRVGSVCSH